MAGINYRIGVDHAPFDKGIGEVQQKLGSVGGILTGAFAPLAVVATAAAGALVVVGGVGLGIGKSVEKAGELETLGTAFAPLLGGAEAAKGRIRELAEFANATPFELPEVARASRVLETLTKGALSTGKGLRMVGDVASATGQPFEEVAMQVGRMYDGLQSGRPVGEAMQRLQELGILSGDVRGQIEGLQKSGKKGDEVWGVAAKALGAFSGSMERQASTWEGMVSTLQDSIGAMFAAFGTPILDALKPYLASLTELTDGLAVKAKVMGEAVAGGLRFVFAAFQTGSVTELIGTALKVGFMEGVNVLWKGVMGVITAAGQGIAEGMKNALLILEIATTGDFWRGLGNALMGVFLSVAGFLQSAIGKALEVLRPVAKLFGKEASVDAAIGQVKENAGVLHGEASRYYGDASGQLGPMVEKVMERSAEAMKNVGAAFVEGYAKEGDVLDASGARRELGDVVGRISEVAKANEGAQKAAAKALDDKLGGGKVAAVEGVPGGKAGGGEVDRLAKLGVFVRGSAQAAAAKVAERTEQWTKLTAQTLQRMAGRSPELRGVFV